MDNQYTLGVCEICGKTTALKNGRCSECEKKELPNWFQDLFRENS